MISTGDPVATATVAAIQDGDVVALRRVVAENPWLATRLIERGAKTTLIDAATLGLLDRVVGYLADSAPDDQEINAAFWGACHGGRRQCAELLLDHGAELDWVPPWENLTPLDAAEREHADELVRWLRDRGAKPATGLPR